MTILRRGTVALTGALLLALCAGSVLATMPSGEVATPLARGALVAPADFMVKVGDGRVKVQTKGALDALMLEITLAPGGTGGWHSHAGPLITVVRQGTLTIVDSTCQRHDVPSGTAMISPGSSSDEDENLGANPVVIDVTFLIPHDVSSPRIDEPAPAGCNL
jgi:quercetin dioxygenase-like cupin family protein